MSGIAGIAESGRSTLVEEMLNKIKHRGGAGRKVIEVEDETLGIVWTKSQESSIGNQISDQSVRDYVDEGHFAEACVKNGRLMLMRDPLGIAPLYYGKTEDGVLCFASEVKALLEATHDIHELPPGCRYDGSRMERYFCLQKQPPSDETPEHIAKELYLRLAASVEKRIRGDVAGSWLSGGLDSSALAALARPHVETLHTFAAGFPDAPDIERAREVADFIGSNHHEVIVNFDELLAVLPTVIYHLESFDALLVRSSITNYLVSKAASKHVPAVFSGEGADELFAGYDYLKSLDISMLPDELIDIENRLHNTALQRVDRSASAHGLIAHVGFLDSEVVDYALRIPAKFKLYNGMEKWILRRAIDEKLPKEIVNRKKAKFWEGAGVSELLAQYANEHITDDEFKDERTLLNGEVINTKEELMYYRIFHRHFGDLTDISWMGRTKGAPKQ